MEAGDIEGRQCDGAVTLAFSILGKRWNGMILDVLGSGPASYVAPRRGVPGISDAVLSDRLAELADAGLVVRDVDAGPPVAVTYALTPGGLELVPVLSRLADWARANLGHPAAV
ncbi:MAG: helix-turn-helix transcriptional regulator [Microbacterium sp.]|nr:helix-turn-helix transcriptional regulator [Microbacterium sp.]